MTSPILRGAIGITGLLLLAWLLSNNRRRFPVRTVIAGLGLQLACAFVVFRLPGGSRVFRAITEFFQRFTSYSHEGAVMVFGELAKEEGRPWGYVFAFNALPMIIYFSAVMAILYYIGVMQLAVYVIARVMTLFMRVSGSESLTVASNIFVGQTEAPLVVKPYIERMTRSEIMAMMTGGFATIAGSVMMVYMRFVGEEYAGHLISASFMAAPAALVVAKVMFPETEVSATAGRVPLRFDRHGANLLDATARGITDGLHLALNVGAMLIAFVAMIGLLNWPLGAFGEWGPARSLLGRLGVVVDAGHPFDFEGALGLLFTPFAWLIGVDAPDIRTVGSLLGIKIAANEFIGYLRLKDLMAERALSPRSITIATYMLCGFANFASIGIQIGGIGAIAPGRRPDLARIAFRAMAAGALTSLLTATLAGVFTS